jgi:hypothetical protein
MITAGSGHVVVLPYTARPYVNMYSGDFNRGIPLGAVRYNPGAACMEIWDGASWQQFRDDSSVDLSNEAKEVLEWARKKMQEEQRLEHLMALHPGLRDLHDRFEVMLRLVQQDGKASV